MHLGIRDERAVHARRHRGARLQIEHVAVAEQRLGAHLVEDGARIDARRHLERDAAGNVGLDEAGDHVDRRTLRREHEVDARGARLLRQPRDQLFDLLADDHHHVGELVDDRRRCTAAARDPWMSRWSIDGIVGGRGRHHRIANRFAGVGGVLHLAVEARDVAHAERGHERVTPLHLRHAPAQRVGGVLHVGDHGREQMRNAFVHRELQHLRIDHDQPHVLGRALVEQRQDHGVDAHRLARAGGAGDEQVRHLREIRAHRRAADVLAERDRQRRGALRRRPST